MDPIDEERTFKDEAEKRVEEAADASDEPELFQQLGAAPESRLETIRQGGMAYAALMTLVGAIIIFVCLGWILDSLFQSSPVFIVGGVILGAIIGFYQFVKFTSKH